MKVNFPVEKPCTPEELVHFGTKGMKWGVRKRAEQAIIKTSQKQPKKLMGAQKKVYGKELEVIRSVHKKIHNVTPEQKAKFKKAGEIAVGAAFVAAGAASVLHTLGAFGNTPMASIPKIPASRTVSNVDIDKLAAGAQQAFLASVRPELRPK